MCCLYLFSFCIPIVLDTAYSVRPVNFAWCFRKASQWLSFILLTLNNGSYYLMDVREPASVGKGADTAHTLDPYAEAKRPWNIAQLRPYYS